MYDKSTKININKYKHRKTITTRAQKQNSGWEEIS